MPSPVLKSLTPEEAIKSFRKKGYAIGFSWRDVWKEEHAVAFTVAKAMRIDILEDIRSATDKAISRGIAFGEFKKQLAPVLQAKGWWGRKEIEDPLDGKLKPATLGSNRRLRTIYDTNMRMAHSAGRWERIERLKDRRPYLRYIAIQDERTRETHLAWHDTVLPVDHPFWDTHYPPNGWRCRCSVQQLGERDLKRFGHKVSTRAPDIGTRDILDRRRGEIHKVPRGIDLGFDYNVGKAHLRAFTPPPKGGLPRSFPPGVGLPELPKARNVAAADVMPDNLQDQEYIDQFTGTFGMKKGQPGVIFTDKAGEDLVISEDLFRDVRGVLKIGKSKNRRAYIKLLALAVQSPDEIWWLWEELKDAPGTWSLRRRYIARFNIEGRQAPGLAVFEHGQDGWTGTTAFEPRSDRSGASQDRYINKQRSGTLAYRRK